MPKIRIGDVEFPSKVSAKNKAQKILHKVGPGGTLEGEDFVFVRSLLDCHPWAEEKIGTGVERIEVRNYQYGTICFWLIRTDGSSEDFSYYKCIAGATNGNS